VLIETKKNCPVYHITFKDLKDFTTTEDDMKKRISKFPTDNYLASSEDLLKIESATATMVPEKDEDTLTNYSE
jgi:hypothetical protein